MKPEFPQLHPEQDKEEYRRLISQEREIARGLKTPAGRLVGLAAAELSEAALED
jgi:hypothetical protein